MAAGMPRKRPGIVCRFVRPPLVIAEQEVAYLGLRFGIGNGGFDPAILGLDVGEDHGIEMSR